MTATTSNRKVYAAHAKQSRFHRLVRQNTDVLFSGGRGSGKTTAGAIQAILEAVEYQPGERGIVIAPTYQMLKDATMFEFFKWLPRQYIANFNRTDHALTLTNGSEVVFRSADNPDSLRGPNRAWLWMDEARNLRTRDAYDIASAQLRPTRKLWITTTPGGIFHWLYGLFYEDPLPGTAAITVKTFENTYLPGEYAERLRAQYTGAFAAQELDAEWVAFEGRVYDNFSLEENVSPAAEYNPDLSILWGLDDGYAHGDGPGSAGYHPRVVLFGQIMPDGALHIFAEYYRTLIPDYQDTLTDVLGWGYPEPELAHVDSSATMLRAALSLRGIANIGATHDVSEGIKNVRRLILDGNGKRQLLIHPRCINLVKEMQTLRYDEGSRQARGGEPKPLKLDDHGPDALRYMAWHLRLT